jgi:hypothetical protein
MSTSSLGGSFVDGERLDVFEDDGGRPLDPDVRAEEIHTHQALPGEWRGRIRDRRREAPDRPAPEIEPLQDVPCRQSARPEA